MLQSEMLLLTGEEHRSKGVNDNMHYVALIDMFLSFSVEGVFFLACTNKNGKRRFMILFFYIKLFVVNYFFDTVLTGRYFSSVDFLTVDVAINVFTQILMMILGAWCMDGEWDRYAVVMLVTELCTMVSTCIPLILFAVFYKVQPASLYKGGYPLRWVAIIISCCCIRLLLNPFFNWIKNRELKLRSFWKIEGVIYWLGGNFMTVKASLKNGDDRLSYIYSYQIWSIIWLIVLVAFIVAALQKQHNRKLELENERLQMQKNMLMDYYRSLMEQINWTRKFRHDIANHMQTVEGLLEIPELRTKETIDYAVILKKQCAKLYGIHYCDNPLINIVFENKAKKCDQNSIPIEIDVSNMHLGRIEEFDFLSLLFNLLDNAIEGCLKVLELKDRKIKTECFEVANQMILIVSNSMSNVVVRQGRFITTKRHKQYHGVGMKIVEDVVEKYNGTLDVVAKDGQFTVRVMMEP